MRWAAAALLFIILFSCKKGDRELVLFYSEGYYEAFPEQKERYGKIKSELAGRFGSPQEVKLQALADYPEESVKVLAEKEGAVLFLEQFMLPPLLNNLGEYKLSGTRVISYGDYMVERGRENLELFNITYRQERLYDELLERCRELGGGEDLSNCLVIYSSDDRASRGFREYLAPKVGYRGKDYDVTLLDFERIRSFFEDETLNVVVLFGGKSNELINESELEKVMDKEVIEVFTEFGKVLEQIDYRFVPDYDLMLSEGFASEEYAAFHMDEEPALDATSDQSVPAAAVEPINYYVESEELFLFTETVQIKKFSK